MKPLLVLIPNLLKRKPHQRFNSDEAFNLMIYICVEMKKYNQLSCEQRYTISCLHKQNKSYREIAQTIGVDKSTISREIKRNKGKRSYTPKHAQMLADERKEWRRYKTKFSPKMKQEVANLMREYQWSPEQIVGRLKLDNKPTVGKTTIYTFLHKDKAQGGDLYLHTRHCLKYRRHRLASRPKTRWGKRTPITERPPEVAQKKRLGDFEMDLIIGKGKQDAILTLVDRVSGFAIIERLCQGKKAEPLAKQAINRLKYLKRSNKIHTITTDNGSEFTAFKKIERVLKIKVYFAKPYCSSDKPHIEHLNKLIRQYIPKSSSFSNLTDEQIKSVEWKLNKRPRKKLKFYTPFERFHLNLH